jgi:lipopolysaccharide transport system permease protein
MKSLFALIRGKIRNALKYRHFFKTIVFKEFKVRYAQSYLGMLWLVLEPLFMVLTLSYVFAVVGRAARHGHPFPLFFYSGLLPWTFFISSFMTGTNAFIMDKKLITKIYFPREISILKQIAINFIDYLFANVAFIVVLIVYDYTPTWFLLYVPVLLLITTLFVYNLTLFTSSISVFVRDIRIVVQTLGKLWFWFTPVLFWYPFSGQTKILYYVNPMAGVISGFRLSILEGKPPEIAQLYSVFGYTLFFIVAGTLVFKKLEKEFVDVL